MWHFLQLSASCFFWYLLWIFICALVKNAPFSSNRQHQSYGGCLEVRGGDYQDCSVLYCVLKLCTVISTLRWAVLTVLWIGFCLTGPISLCLDSFVFMRVFFVLSCHTAYVLYYCNMVGWTWLDWSLIPDMTYNVFGGTLNPTQPLLIQPCTFLHVYCGSLSCDVQSFAGHSAGQHGYKQCRTSTGHHRRSGHHRPVRALPRGSSKFKPNGTHTEPVCISAEPGSGCRQGCCALPATDWVRPSNTLDTRKPFWRVFRVYFG